MCKASLKKILYSNIQFKTDLDNNLVHYQFDLIGGLVVEKIRMKSGEEMVIVVVVVEGEVVVVGDWQRGGKVGEEVVVVEVEETML